MKLVSTLIDRTTGTVRGILGKVTGLVIPPWLKIVGLVLIAAVVLGVVL